MMTTNLETRLLTAKCGEIIYNENGRIEHHRLSDKTLTESPMVFFHTLVNTTLVGFFEYLPVLRRFANYQGIASWRHADKYIILETMITKSKSPVSVINSLISEIESIAKLKDCKYISCNTSIPRKNMERLGWEYGMKISTLYNRHSYRKAI